eukprot:1004328_1
MTDSAIPMVETQNKCDQSMVRCKSSESGSLQSCDGRWAFKAAQREVDVNPFVVVGAVITSFKSTDESPAGSTASGGASTSSLLSQLFPAWSAYSAPSTTTTSSCHTLMKLSGNQMVDGIQWQRIEDPDREHGE